MGFEFENNHWEALLHRLDTLINVGRESIVLGKESLTISKEILKVLEGTTQETISIKWKNGETNMPLILPMGDQDQGFITVALTTPPSTTPVPQSALPAGQTIQLVSADPATFTVTLDSPAVPDPDGTVSVASFTVVSAAAPAQPNVAVAITLTILNADGSTAASASDTVTVSETATESIGILFGTPVVIPASAQKK